MNVADNWRTEEGPCKDCDICDPGGYTPKPGCFNKNAPIMLIGYTPGEKKDNAERSRRDKLYKSPSKNHDPLTPDEQATNFLDGWTTGHEAMKRRLFGLNYNPGYETLKHPRESIYYTNIIKCSLVGSDADVPAGNKPEKLNASAKKQCPNYLEEEIRNVEPEVILIVRSAVSVLNDRFDTDIPTKGKEAIGTELPIKAYDIDYFDFEPSLIVIYHWSRSSSPSYLPWMGSDLDEFYRELINRITQITGDRVVGSGELPDTIE